MPSAGVRPQTGLLLFAAAVFVFHQLPAFAGEPAGLASTLAFALAAAMIGGYAIWQGGVPQFTEAGLL